LKAARSSSEAAFRCVGRTLCKVKPNERSTCQALVSCSRRPVSCSIQSATFLAVHNNNFFEDINGAKWGGAGYFLKSTDWDGLTIENNTIIQSGSIASAYGKPIKNFIFRNNIVFENEYGIKGDNMGSGQEVINKFFSNGTVTGNIIIGGKSSLYREKNFFVNSIGQVGFVNAEKGDYRLRSDSPYLNKGFGGKRIGADLDAKLVGGK
jgi:hypothetical protein